MQLSARADALYGDNIRALDLRGEDDARFHGATVDVHGAGAALPGVAADVGAGQPQVLAQKLHQQRARIKRGADGFAVDGQGDGNVH